MKLRLSPPAARRLIGIGAIVCALALGYAWLAKNPPIGPFEGERAPDFRVVSLEGEPLELAQLRGSPLIINFWATWCEPCLREMPLIQRAHERYGDQVQFVAVTSEPASIAKPYVEEGGYTFGVYVDEGSRMSQTYLAHLLPMTLFVDANGVIVARHVGELNQAQLEAFVIGLLAA